MIDDNPVLGRLQTGEPEKVITLLKASDGDGGLELREMHRELVTLVTAIPAAPSAAAVEHFEALLAFETDCWDVHEGSMQADPNFVVLDVRSPELFAAGHVPGSVNLPHRRINERNLDAYPKDMLFVVYCAGPHCNGADKAAARLATLGRPVKKMIGGIEGWKDEGFGLETAN